MEKLVSLDITGSGNGLSPIPLRDDVTIWTNTKLLSSRPLGRNFSENFIKIKKNTFENVCKTRSIFVSATMC